jgi:hypothetical protein
MSFKSKQEAFAALKNALAIIQKINAPLPPLAMSLVASCVKIVAANTKTVSAKSEPDLGDKDPQGAGIDALINDFSPESDTILEELKKRRVIIQGHLDKKDAETAKKELTELKKYYADNKAALEKDAKTEADKTKLATEQKAITDLETAVNALPTGTSFSSVKEELKKYRTELQAAQKALSEKPNDEALQKQLDRLVLKAEIYQENSTVVKEIAEAKGDTKELIDEYLADIKILSSAKPVDSKKATIYWTYKVSGKNSKKDESDAKLLVVFSLEQKNNKWQFVSINCTAGKSYSDDSKDAKGDKQNIAPFSVSAADKANINASNTILHISVQRNATKRKSFDALGALLGIGQNIKPKPDPNNTNPAVFVLPEQYDADPSKIPEEIKKNIIEKTNNGELTTVIPQFSIEGDIIKITGLEKVLSSLNYQKTIFAAEFAESKEIK